MKKLKNILLISLCLAATAFTTVFSGCGLTEYDRQKSAINAVRTDEKYTFVSTGYIGNKRVETTVGKYVKRLKKSNTNTVYGFPINDRYYFLGRYYSTHKDEDYNGENHYMNYVLGYISCPSGKITVLKWLENLPAEYSYSSPCSLTAFGEKLLFKAGGKNYKIDGVAAKVTELETALPDGYYTSCGNYLFFYKDEQETKAYTALNSNFVQLAAFEVEKVYSLKTARGDYAFFTAEGLPVRAFNVATGKEFEGDGKELYENLVAVRVTSGGVCYTVDYNGAGVTFSDGENVLEVTNDDISEKVAAMAEIENIYGKKFYIRQVYGQDGDVFLRLDNPREYDMVFLPNLFGFGLEYTVSIVIRYEPETGALKYAGYFTGTAQLRRVYKK